MWQSSKIFLIPKFSHQLFSTTSFHTPSLQTPLKPVNMLNPNYQILPLNSLHLVNSTFNPYSGFHSIIMVEWVSASTPLQTSLAAMCLSILKALYVLKLPYFCCYCINSKNSYLWHLGSRKWAIDPLLFHTEVFNFIPMIRLTLN